MNGRLLFLSLSLSSSLVCAQRAPQNLPDRPEDLLPELPPPPHLDVVQGRDNPSAIPLHAATLLSLNGRYGRDVDGRRPAVDRFADSYATDGVLAEAMVTAIRQVHSELQANAIAQRQAFCARTFTDESSWRAAVIAFDADSASAQVAAFNKLRDIAGRELWEKILLEANEATRSMVMVRDNHDSAVAELGYEKAFSNQCRNVSKE